MIKFILLILLVVVNTVVAPSSPSSAASAGRAVSVSSSRSSPSSSSSSSSASGKPSGYGRSSYTGRTRTVSSASSSIYGPGLSKYRGPIGNYPAGTRAAYVYPGSYYYYGYPWLLFYGDDLSEYQESDAGISIDPNELPPGCELTNQTVATPNNETLHHAETASFWMQPVVYNIGNESIACSSIDITEGADEGGGGLSGGAIAGIVIASVVVAIVVIVILCMIFD